MPFSGEFHWSITRRIAARYLCYGVEADALTVKLDLPRTQIDGIRRGRSTNTPRPYSL
jgi:hypothetical protein